MPNKKKGLLIIIIALIVIVLAVAGYYFIIKKADQPVAWDGYYKMTGTLNCTGNFPDLTTLPMDTTVVVSSNKLVDQSINQSFDIDKHGKVTEIVGQTTNNGVTTDAKVDYQFSKEGDIYKFIAEGVVHLNAEQNGQSYSSTCSGTISGVKQ